MPFDNIETPKLTSCATVLLLRARMLLENPRRWSVGQQNRGHLWWKQYCAVGALRHVADTYALEAGDAAEGVLHDAAVARGFTDAAALNDHPDTTHTVILDLFSEAAELAKEPVV